MQCQGSLGLAFRSLSHDTTSDRETCCSINPMEVESVECRHLFDSVVLVAESKRTT